MSNADRIAMVWSLAAAERFGLLDEVSANRVRELPAAEREAIQQAALRFSETSLGRRTDGKLLEVSDATEKRLQQLAGEYLK